MTSSAIISAVFVLVHCPNGFGIHYGPSIVSLLPKISPNHSQQVDAMLKGVGNIWKNSSLYTNSNVQETNTNASEIQDNPVKIFLKDYPDFSVVLPIIENRPWATAMEIWRLTFPSYGEKRFSIQAPENHGIVAVIQELDIKVRQGSTSSCGLYIKFGDSESTSERICGKIHKGDPTIQPKLLIGPRSFISSNGKMTIYFNAFPGLLGVHIRVAVAFTAYKEGCYFNMTDTKDFDINPKEYKPCKLRGWSSSCIKSKLFCDNVINCGDREEFEKDEANCFNNVNVEHLIPIRKIIPSQNENDLAPTFTAETRYILYSHFTSSVIGIIGFFTLFFVIRYMITRTCGGAAKSKPLVGRRFQNSTANNTNLNIEMEERNPGDSNVSTSIEPSSVLATASSTRVITSSYIGHKFYSMTRSPQDDPPSYFDLFPHAEENCDSRNTSQTQI